MGVRLQRAGSTSIRNREAFGYRRKTDGWNCEGSRDQSYRKPVTPMTPDGEVDVEALKEAEMLMLLGTWKGSGTNSGVGVVQGTVEEEGDQWSVTEQNRHAARLTNEAQERKQWKKDRSI